MGGEPWTAAGWVAQRQARCLRRVVLSLPCKRGPYARPASVACMRALKACPESASAGTRLIPRMPSPWPARRALAAMMWPCSRASAPGLGCLAGWRRCATHSARAGRLERNRGAEPPPCAPLSQAAAERRALSRPWLAASAHGPAPSPRHDGPAPSPA